MFVEIVFVRLSMDRDEVEEALEAAFGVDGEVAGAGGGVGRCHLDLEIAAGLDKTSALKRLEGVSVAGVGVSPAQVGVKGPAKGSVPQADLARVRVCENTAEVLLCRV
ncbi:hypothetical protein [Streptomyces sp. NBC_01262]|uniref:hypothetical protein n=1 Tax=Streptomyces sp. NBC_01262 TaxID=2903803 RepID=UPI002E35ED3B|nr:hypothetical protein [Streptomyces sp. NBC_01262]